MNIQFQIEVLITLMSLNKTKENIFNVDMKYDTSIVSFHQNTGLVLQIH